MTDSNEPGDEITIRVGESYTTELGSVVSVRSISPSNGTAVIRYEDDKAKVVVPISFLGTLRPKTGKV